MPEPVDLLIEHGVVLPMTGASDLLWDGAVAIDDGRIVAVGPTADLRVAYEPARTIGAHDQLVMPGLCNTCTCSAPSRAAWSTTCRSPPGSRRSST
ncbi:MAG TPA: hypothetical protein VHR88_05525 [Solirubrobacteraceae bacterium]|nr:hypothetical protein [Solirubrobacteraceae bacterium]